MAALWNSVFSFLKQIFTAFAGIQWYDIVDVLILTFVIYKAVGFLKETRAGQLVKGIIILIFAYACSYVFKLTCLKWMLSKVFDWAILAIAVIFQPEIRRLLERVGRTQLGTLGKSLSEDSVAEIKNVIDEISQAANSMHDQKIGALIVFERKTQLGEIINTGTLMKAKPSKQLVENVFYPKSPLHDGAMVVRDGEIYAAGCILPLTNSNNISSNLGTRHRAAIGMSENSDAVILTVSEETGGISISVNGEITTNLDIVSLRNNLYDLLIDTRNTNNDESFVTQLKTLLNTDITKRGKK